MASSLKIIKSYLLRLSPLALMGFFLAYSAVIWQVFSLMIRLPIYISAPILCISSLPVSGVCLWFLKKGQKRSKVFAFLYLLPTLIWWLLAGAIYIWSSFLGGEFFLSVVLYASFIGCGAISLCLVFASVLTLLLFKVTSEAINKNRFGRDK